AIDKNRLTSRGSYINSYEVFTNHKFFLASH
ncbi:unnamed protein product, partial [marine sediment metagenome]